MNMTEQGFSDDLPPPWDRLLSAKIRSFNLTPRNGLREMESSLCTTYNQVNSLLEISTSARGIVLYSPVKGSLVIVFT